MNDERLGVNLDEGLEGGGGYVPIMILNVGPVEDRGFGGRVGGVCAQRALWRVSGTSASWRRDRAGRFGPGRGLSDGGRRPADRAARRGGGGCGGHGAHAHVAGA